MKKKLGLMILSYFRILARLQLKKYAPDIIGITGSSGKTTTVSAVVALLKDKYRLKYTRKANSESGIPLDILGLEVNDYSLFNWLRLTGLAIWKLLTNWQPYEKYVVEMGIDSPLSPKNMEYLLSIVKPRTGIFLNALLVHSENFKGIKDIAQEKGKLITHLPKNGLAIINADDPNILKLKTEAQMMTFGHQTFNDVQIDLIYRHDLATEFNFIIREENIKINLSYLLPNHYAYSLAAAICVGLDEGMSLMEIKDKLERNFKLEPGRMGVFLGVNDSLIVDSSYNASAEPTVEILNLLKTLPGKKIAVLGDMRELGKETRQEHERVMDTAMKTMDELVLVGPLMNQYALPYLTKQKFKPVSWFENSHQAGMYLKGTLAKNDILVIKGSQNQILLETTVEMLLKNPDDKVKLCRRGKYWDEQRKALIQ